MKFGNLTDFAIEAYHEPSGPEWVGFGRISYDVEGIRLADIGESHCSLFHAVERLRELAGTIESLWNESFEGLSDAGIFEAIDQGLYLGDEPMWDRYGKFDFLTNAGESFDDFKTFIVCRPKGRVHILFESRDGNRGSASCSVHSFRATSQSFVVWFDGQTASEKLSGIEAVDYIAARASRANDAAFLEAMSHIPEVPVTEEWDKPP